MNLVIGKKSGVQTLREKLYQATLDVYPSFMMNFSHNILHPFEWNSACLFIEPIDKPIRKGKKKSTLF